MLISQCMLARFYQVAVFGLHWGLCASKLMFKLVFWWCTRPCGPQKAVYYCSSFHLRHFPAFKMGQLLVWTGSRAQFTYRHLNVNLNVTQMKQIDGGGRLTDGAFVWELKGFNEVCSRFPSKSKPLYRQWVTQLSDKWVISPLGRLCHWVMEGNLDSFFFQFVGKSSDFYFPCKCSHLLYCLHS